MIPSTYEIQTVFDFLDGRHTFAEPSFCFHCEREDMPCEQVSPLCLHCQWEARFPNGEEDYAQYGFSYRSGKIVRL